MIDNQVAIFIATHGEDRSRRAQYCTRSGMLYDEPGVLSPGPLEVTRDLSDGCAVTIPDHFQQFHRVALTLDMDSVAEPRRRLSRGRDDINRDRRGQNLLRFGRGGDTPRYSRSAGAFSCPVFSKRRFGGSKRVSGMS